ncbi:alpha-(1-_3)-arabinofuranosyltransferase [Nocardiopsis rhodophaea]|uniref:Alpha-(1->3)-arabinofuranosyltransferase n=1 Tax=Nocardiopsis rhodophaea TaxID=280238 RepID=A0ABN2T4J1_9ACTN
MTLPATHAPNGRGDQGGPGEEARPDTDTNLLRRLKLLGVCLLLSAVAFSLDPQLIVGDTKIDLTINPFGFLERALYLWDPSYFGQLQNQAYGYFFPNGPFHALLIALDMPEWLVQRTWMAVLLCAAFLGTFKLAAALGIGTTNTRIIAGVAYALAPRVLTLISYNSAELQPMMLLPWIILPLVYGARHGRDPMRMAMLSGVAFLLCGGTNAASELAVLVVPLIYLLTRANGARKFRLLAWWLTALFLVSFWWLAPLLVMGSYVFSFMPFTEDAATTTGVTSLINALRGASNWMGYVPTQGQPPLPAGAELSTEPWLVVATALVAGLGLAGLINRRMPERVFLVVSVLTGTAIIVAGYTGDLTGPLAPTMQAAFDGILSPFRNIHKFDALIRLPLVLGLAHLPVVAALDAADRRSGWIRTLGLSHHVVRRAVAGTVAVAFLITLTPVATVGVATRGGFERIPGYWYEAAKWLDAHNSGPGGMTMAVPGSARGEYEWGRPMDEPMQPLMRSAWTNQQIIPWGSAGVSRLTHELDQRISSGRGSAGLTATLSRMGVTYLLVRNDLQRTGNNGGWPARVHQALRDSPGITRVVAFGPEIGATEAYRASEWYDQPYRSLEIYKVGDGVDGRDGGPAPVVGTVPADKALRVTGGPESLLSMAEQGILRDDRPVIVGDDPGAEDIAPENTVVTDTARRREVVYSDVRHNVSHTLTADEEYERDAPAPDIQDPAWEGYTAVAKNRGIASVTASSSEAGANASPGTRDPGRAPFAALDDSFATSWRSSGFTGSIGQWLEVEFDKPRDLRKVSIAFEQITGEPPPSEIALVTDDDRVTAPVSATGKPQDFRLPSGETKRLRIQIKKLAWEPDYRFGSRVGITDIDIPGLDASRTLDVPGVAGAGTMMFTGSTGTVPGCMEGSEVWVCNPRLAVQGEDAFGMDRTFEVSKDAASKRHTVRGEAVVIDPVDVENAANRAGGYPKITSSSTSVRHPAAVGRNAFDGDDKTVWYPDPDEDQPQLDVDLGKSTKLNGMRVEFPRGIGLSRPIRVTVDTGSTVREAWLDGNGWVNFAPVTTDKLTITFDPPENQPLEIQRIALPGVKPLKPIKGGDATTACGLGPVLRVNGERVETRIVSGTLEDKLNGKPLGYESCDDVDLKAGSNRLVVKPGNQYQVDSAIVEQDGTDLAARAEKPAGSGGEKNSGDSVTPVTTADVPRLAGWGNSERRFDVAVDEDSYLVVNENFNDGWEATVEGSDDPLEPVRLDGWKQAWQLPAGTHGTVTLSYAPDGIYHLALGVGAVLALLAGVLALRRPKKTRPAARLAAAVPGRVGRVGRIALVPAGVGLGLWVAGASGAAVTGAVLVFVWWLGRAPSGRLRHARPERPALGGRIIRWLAGPWTVTVALACAGISLAVGTYLSMYMPFHDIGELLGDPLRGWVAQLFCLPAVARMVVSLGGFTILEQPEPDADAHRTRPLMVDTATDASREGAPPGNGNGSGSGARAGATAGDGRSDGERDVEEVTT